jgi:hypothetical protein
VKVTNRTRRISYSHAPRNFANGFDFSLACDFATIQLRDRLVDAFERLPFLTDFNFVFTVAQG